MRHASILGHGALVAPEMCVLEDKIMVYTSYGVLGKTSAWNILKRHLPSQLMDISLIAAWFCHWHRCQICCTIVANVYHRSLQASMPGLPGVADVQPVTRVYFTSRAAFATVKRCFQQCNGR